MRHLTVLACLSIFIIASLEAQKSYTIEEFLKASDKELIKHKQELDSLIEKRNLIFPNRKLCFFTLILFTIKKG